MIKHNALTILKNLTTGEISSFRRFLNSPYHNKSKKVIKLYNILLKYYPEFSNKIFTKEKVYSLLNPGAAYNDSTFRALMHDLYKLLQVFLINENISVSRPDRMVILIKELYKRKIFPVLEHQINISESIFDGTEPFDNMYYYRFLLETYKYNYNSLTSQTLKKGTASRQYSLISDSDIYLALFFITEFISDYTNQVIYKSKFNIDDKDSFSARFIKVLDAEKLLPVFYSYPELRQIAILYNQLYRLYLDIRNKAKYENYRDSIRSLERSLNSDEASFHYSKLISCCILNHELEGNLFYNRELFDIYDYFLKNKLYSDNKSSFLPANLFRTVLLNALRLKKFRWVLSFIENYIPEIEESERENIYLWSFAVYYNETGDNKRSLEFINKIKATYFIFKYDLYNIKLKIFYEMENPETALNYIRTYREFLRNDKFFSGKRKAIYLNFIKSVELLIKCREKKNLYFTDHLKNQYLNTDKILYKEWIQQKIMILESDVK